VVAVHEPAEVQAVELRLPERPVGLQRPELGCDLARTEPLADPAGEAAHQLQVLPEHPVHPQEFLEEGLAERLSHAAESMMCSETSGSSPTTRPSWPGGSR
jgi:hypothetical protein